MSDAANKHPVAANHGVRVTLAGLGINLSLGVLYSWSVISKGVPETWGWLHFEKSLPYSTACLVFCLVMVPAGRMQDRLGPRLVATLGGILVGLGMILASFCTSAWGYVLGFGVLVGAGIGCGYASTTPPAVKWFPAARTGMIAGIVVSGFGLASAYAAPLTDWLIHNYGLAAAMRYLGVGFLIAVAGLAQLLEAPPAGYVPAGGKPPTRPGVSGGRQAGPGRDYRSTEMLAAWQFYALWLMYACGAGAGLMIIGKLADITKLQLALDVGPWLVATLAVGNGAGRVVAGIVSDRIGRQATLLVCFVMQAVLILVLSQTSAGALLARRDAMIALSALIGANFGANLALFPAITKDYFGLKYFGTNYGLVFTAWGLGGFMLALLAGWIYDRYQTFNFAYYTSAVLLVMAAGATMFVRPPRTVADVLPAVRSEPLSP